jgi:site-specific DNA-methyltransferase (adenine-specific)
VLRDVTERIVIASKGRFDRAVEPRRRRAAGLPVTVTISRDEFMEATTDLWELSTESATRVGHPAPFPVELPQRVIDLYTYAGDVVLDPFMGSGSTAVAAVRTGRHYIGFDTDPSYVALAHRRLAEEPGTDPARRVAFDPAAGPPVEEVDPEAAPSDTVLDLDLDLDQARRAGLQARDVARLLVDRAGFTDVATKVKPRGTGVEVDLVGADPAGRRWAFLVSGGFTATRTGLRRADTLWRALGQAAVLRAATDLSVVLLTSDLPARSTPGHQALRQALSPAGPVTAAIDITAPDAVQTLARLTAD